MAPSTTSKSTTMATVATVINNIIGGGLLALPFTFKRASLVPGIVAMCITAALNCTTMGLLGTSCEISGARNYKELGHICFGPRINVLISGLMALYTLGSCVSYIVLIGDNLPEVLSRAGGTATNPGLALFASRESLAVLSAAIVLFPLSSFRNLNSLRYTSRVSFLCILYTTLMIAVRAGMGPLAPADKVVVMRGGTGLFIGFPITMVAFTMHYNTPRFYFELQGHSPAKFGAIAAACFAFTLVVYQTMATCGYLLFGTDTLGDVLENFPEGDNAAFAARVALSAVMLFSYPLAFNSYRASFVALMPSSWQTRQAAGPDIAAAQVAALEAGGATLSWARRTAIGIRADLPHLLTTAALVALSVGIAIAIPQIELVLGYKGALGGTVIVYVLPGLMYYTLTRRMKAQGITLADVARLKRDLGSETRADGTYITESLIPSADKNMVRVAEPGESSPSTPGWRGRGTSSVSASTPVATGPAFVSATAAAHTPLIWGNDDAATGRKPLLGAEDRGDVGSDAAVSKFLAVSVRGLPRSESVTMLGQVDIQPWSGAAPGTWTSDLFRTPHGWAAVFFAVWGVMVMVLGTATTAGLLA